MYEFVAVMRLPNGLTQRVAVRADDSDQRRVSRERRSAAGADPQGDETHYASGRLVGRGDLLGSLVFNPG